MITHEIRKIKENNAYPDPVKEKYIYIKMQQMYLENLSDKKKMMTTDITQ